MNIPNHGQRRRWILKHYGRGPRKKPPDKPPPPLGRKKTLTVDKVHRIVPLHPLREGRYKRCRRAISNPLRAGRATAPFLAGSPCCYHHISNSYRQKAAAGRAPSHGYIPIIGTHTQNLHTSRCVSLFFVWFSIIFYNIEVIYTSHQPNTLLYGAVTFLLLDWTLKILMPCTSLNVGGLRTLQDQ